MEQPGADGHRLAAPVRFEQNTDVGRRSDVALQQPGQRRLVER